MALRLLVIRHDHGPGRMCSKVLLLGPEDHVPSLPAIMSGLLIRSVPGGVERFEVHMVTLFDCI
jgi:hypothetical protein